MDHKLCLKLGILFFLTWASARAEQSNLDLSQRYLLLATSRTSTLQDEISEAVESGYSVVTAWSGADGGEAACRPARRKWLASSLLAIL